MADVGVLELRLLGRLLILVGGTPRRVTIDKQAALLVYLGIHQGQVVRREVLADLLWEGADPDRARHSLSQALYQLRRKVPELVINATREEVWIEAGSIRLDVDEFREAIEEERFEEAAGLYGGSFLAGFWVAGVKAFEEWQARQEAELGRLARFALQKLLREAEVGGDWLRVIRLSTRILELDPYNEGVHRSRIEAIAASEGRQQALAELQRAAELIEMDLERGLESATLELKRILEQDPSSPGGPREDEERGHATPFIGRAEEFGWLRDEWESVKSGDGRCVVVIGEPGIGKSRLCEQFLRLCAIQGARIIRGRSHATDMHLPYSAIVGMILESIREEELARLSPEWLAVLVELLPEFRYLLGGAEQQMPIEGEGGRRRLFEAFAQLFLKVCADSPLVLHFDDFQWADESSVALFQYCVRRLAGEPALILLSMRPEGEARLAPLTPGGDTEGEGDGYSRLELAPMSLEDVEGLIEAFAERNAVHLPERVQVLVYDRVGGRPFFVLEIIRAIALGEISWEDAEGMEWERPFTIALPATVEEFLGRSLHGLGPEAESVISALAVLGASAEPQIVRRVALLDQARFLSGLDELLSRGLVAEVESDVVFLHDLIREAAYRLCGNTKLRMFHEAAANELLASGGSNAEICEHYNAAGRKYLAYEYALLAAGESGQIYGHKETEYFLRLALANATDGYQRDVALEKLARLLYSLGRWVESEQYLSMLVSSPRLDQSGSRYLANYARFLASKLKQGFKDTGVLTGELTALVEKAERIKAYKVVIEASKSLIYIGDVTGNHDLVLSSIERVSHAAEHVRDTTYEVAALAYSSNVLSLYQGVTPARPYAEEAVRRATGSRDRTAEIVAFSSRGMNHLQSGRLSEAEADFRRALSLIERYAAISYQQFVLNTYGVVLLERGSFEEARRVLGEAVELARNSAALQDLVVVTGNLLLVEYESGNREGAIGLAEEVIDLSVKATLLWCTIGAWSILGLYAIDRGDLEAARRCRDGLLSHATGRDFWISDASYAEIFLARLAVMEGDRSGALERLDRAIAAYTDREFFCRARLHLERARVIHPKDRIEAGRWVEEVRSMGMESGAEPLIIAADRVSKEFSAAASL